MTTDLFNLTDKVALVTGASRGIGEAIARLLAEQGAHVIIASRKIDACQAVVDAITNDGGSAEPFACNTGNMEDIEAIFDHIRKKHDRLDILVNNAATNPYFGDILDTDLSSFQKAVDVNIRGYFFMSTNACKLMKEKGGGAIVNVASTNALKPGLYQGIYSITKAAVVNMTRAFAKTCAVHNIRVNALLPGLTQTRFSEALFRNEQIHKTAMETIPMHRHAEPGEMAGTVLYLVSDAATYTNGEYIVVDGGLTV